MTKCFRRRYFDEIFPTQIFRQNVSDQNIYTSLKYTSVLNTTVLEENHLIISAETPPNLPIICLYYNPSSETIYEIVELLEIDKDKINCKINIYNEDNKFESGLNKNVKLLELRYYHFQMKELSDDIFFLMRKISLKNKIV